MRYTLPIFLLVLFATTAMSQVTIEPQNATADDEITITYDASQGTSGLVGASRVFMHSGVILDGPAGTSWQHVVGNWGDPDAPGEMTSLGDNKWSFTMTPREYFAQAGLNAGATVYRIGMVFREAGPCGGFGGNSSSCAEGKTASNSDIFVDLNAFSLTFTNPTENPLFVDQNDVITISLTSSDNASITLFANEVPVKTENDATALTYDFTASTIESVTFRALGDTGESTFETSTVISVRQPTVSEPRPGGIIDGINYDADASKVTLSLWAPMKESVIVSGDFNNWSIDPANQMKKDGEHFWIELSGLTPGEQYGFQYLVDESIWVADPYADMILDPDDWFISNTTYPNLKTYPEKALRDEWYMNRVSVFQTDQTDYQWQVLDFQKPEKENLVVYELLMRDFFGEGQQNWQTLIDTLSYFESLGVNAIELMPIMEFNGNDSWGYNPTFMFAPDKYYGEKNKLKEFIDTAHSKGIAVILDVTMNHQDIPGTYLSMYYDFNDYKPTAENPWFNVNPKHPFNVFFDFDHESSYTQAYLDTINHYWLNEYKVDGYRFDLSKGFTQVNSGSDVGFWSSYDQSRVNLLTRMANEIWADFPDAYVILEHFADNNEEKILSNYGMMIWGNMNHVYNELAMGYEGDTDISWGYYGTRSFNDPHLISYMESHDEERMAYKLAQFGNSVVDYSTKEFGVSMQRIKTAASIFYTLPGPKMLWQFGELGYDVSIDFNGRVSRKPVLWEYYEEDQRRSLRSVIAELIKLKTTYPIFTTNDVQFTQGSTMAKNIVLKGDPYVESPASADEMNVVVVANLNLTTNIQSVDFPHGGTWYSYFTEDEIEANSGSTEVQLPPGQFVIYTDFELDPPDVITSTIFTEEVIHSIYPNPSRGKFVIQSEKLAVQNDVQLFSPTGQLIWESSVRLQNGVLNIDLNGLKQGVYILTIPSASIRQRIIIN